MRYYDIEIEGGERYKSLAGGVTDPGALNVEMDIQIVSSDTPASGSYLRIWGLGLKAISQTENIFNKTIKISGGFSRGLPLANVASRYAGKLATGTIFQAFGNWIGTDQTLDIVFVPGTNPPVGGGPNPRPPAKNLTLDWKKGKPLKQALEKCLRQGYKDVEIIVEISDKLVARRDEPGFSGNLEQLALYVRRISQDILGGQAAGVSVVNNNEKIHVFDDTVESGKIDIKFEDLIGQPTWIRPETIQFKTVMRGDIRPGDEVTLPKTFFNSSIDAAFRGTSAATGQVAFSGSFLVSTLRHVGNYRQATADAWVTIVEAYTAQPAGSTAGSTFSGDHP